MTIVIIIISILVITIGLVFFLKSKKENKDTSSSTPIKRAPPPKEMEEPKKLPPANYPKYDHSRIISTLGLTEDDAIEFIADLIAQIDTTIPQIKSAIDSKNFESMESLTHSIKGSATNLGTGGVASLLIDFNTYLKTKKDLDIINKYFEHLTHYTKELKEQYA